LIYFLLGFYFIEDEEFLEANERIQSLLTKVINLSRPRFRAHQFISGLSQLNLQNPISSVRKAFNIYIPSIRKIAQSRVSYLKS
jgi:hypothetical protein